MISPTSSAISSPAPDAPLCDMPPRVSITRYPTISPKSPTGSNSETYVNGELETEHLSNLTEQEAIELGSKIGALIGLGVEGEEGMEAGALAGAEEAAAEGINVFGDADAWDVLEDIPNDSAAALILLEHHWAVPLRDAIARAGGFRISDGFISPLDLVAIGLMSAEEAKELHVMETAAASAGRPTSRTAPCLNSARLVCS